MSSADKSSSTKSPLSVQVIVLTGIFWAVAALLFFLLFSVTPPGQPRPFWYSLGTLIFEATSYFAAAILCLRNWRSPQIVSGRNVWLGIGLGMFSYFLGNLVFGYWELGLGQEPAISPADFFFVLTYIFLGWGMASAVFNRRLNLEIWQWGCVTVIAIVGIALAAWISSGTPTALLESPAYAQTAPASPSPAKPPATKPSPAKPAVKASPAAAPSPKPAVPTASPSPTAAAEQKPELPAWAVETERLLQPLKDPVNLFYLICDVGLLILATMLLLAFWGGRFSQSWRMIAAAAFCLYIADIWFKYADNRITDYQSGSLPEVFWVFSGVLFAIGAALEFDISSRSRSRTGGRRRAAG
jgi:hypothetical protein